ncbi:MAG: MoxR family ATPase [Candidatus Moraniibacteriota bacterium]
MQRPKAPRWRQFGTAQSTSSLIEMASTLPTDQKAKSHSSDGQHRKFISDDGEIELVNAALYLRRPLLVTGKPGVGKSSLAYAVADELGLGQVLVWPINSRSNLRDALYSYDAIGRLQAANFTEPGDPLPDIGEYIQLGPLGTALLPWSRPRVLLIDEIDKSDIDLPNDLLNVFETGRFVIPELIRLAGSTETEAKQDIDASGAVTVRTSDENQLYPVINGTIQCHDFPIVVITSNGERELPAPFLRRCIRLDINLPNQEKLRQIVDAHFLPSERVQRDALIKTFLDRQARGDNLATDQILNALYLANTIATITSNSESTLEVAGVSRESLVKALMRPLDSFS